MPKFFVFILILGLISGCDEWLASLDELKDDYENPKLHENGVDQSIPHNAQIGKDWMNDVYYRNNPMSEIQRPHGCRVFNKTLYVSTIGSDTNNGTISSSLATVNKAIQLANNDECTLIKVLNGKYFQTINLKDKKNITIAGNDRVTTQLLSKKELEGWEDISEQDCNITGRCKTIKLTIEGSYTNHFHLLYKDKVSIPANSLARFSFREIAAPEDFTNASTLLSAEIVNNLPNIIISDDLSELSEIGKEKFRKHVIKMMETDTSAYRYMNSGVMDRNDLTWKGVGSSFYVHPGLDSAGNPISTIFFRAYDNDEDADQHISTHLGYSAYINDSQNIVIQNLSLYNGRYGLAVTRDSHNIKVFGNLFRGHYRSIYIYGGIKEGIKYAPSNIEVYGNQISNNLDLNMSPQFVGAYRNFNLVKKGLSDAHGVYLLNTGENNNIHHNFIYNAGNGVQSSNDNKEDFQTINLKVHHNLIINTIDDGLEPGGSCIKCRWYANHLRNTSQSLRLKIRDNNSIGPVYIYNNVFYNQDKYNYTNNLVNSNQTNIFYHTASSIPIYIYNNTFLGFRCFIMPTRDSATGGPNLYFLNNIFSCKYSMPNAREGAWPLWRFDPALQEFDENDAPIPLLSAKNNQPLHSSNWFGGIQDDRVSIISSSGNLRNLYKTEKMHNLALDSQGNPLNYVYRAQSDEQPVHIFDSFDADNSHLLERTNFCPNQSPFSNDLEEGLNLRNINNLSWNYVYQVQYSNSTLHHKITRRIEEELPSTFAGNHPIGPFKAGDRSCNNFEWLLEDN